MTLNVLVERICNETGLAIATPYHVDDTIEDELYKEAVELVRRLNKASAPLLQRRLRIGYSRAAALIDMMEERGVVGPQLSESKPREVLPERSVSSTSLAMSAIIGDPFDWCEVPAGEFLYSRSKQNLTLPAFVIAKYPITYAQFQTFIDAPDGFFDNRWWGGLAVTTEQRQKPGDQQWKINMHPRENVSWYDAIAFCRWLSYKLGGNFDLNQVTQWTVRLPTAYEWEKAARGTDGRIYPYGDDFDEAKSNTDESGIKKTTPVTQYPQGASPYGALDMSGNVWEWCLTNYHHPTPNVTNENLNSDIQRFLRGGSWQNAQNDSRCTSRGQGLLPYRSANLGFRICAATV